MSPWKKVRIWLLFLSPSILVGTAIGLYPGYKLYNYAWNEAAFCVTCHVHDYANVGHKQSIHGDVTTCHDCHHQRLRDYMRETWIMATRPPTFPKDLHHTPYVKKEICAACHLSNAADRSTITGPMSFEDVQQIPKVDLSHLHAVHLGKTTELKLLNSHELSPEERNASTPSLPKEFPKEKGEERSIGCADCHGGPTNRGHNFSASDLSCVRCHEGPHKSKLGMEVGCRSCHFHEFMIPKELVKDPNKDDAKAQQIRKESEKGN